MPGAVRLPVEQALADEHELDLRAELLADERLEFLCGQGAPGVEPAAPLPGAALPGAAAVTVGPV